MRILLALALTLALAGCRGIGHVVLLRDAQARFDAASTLENGATISNLTRAPLDTLTGWQPGKPADFGLPVVLHRQLCSEYGEVIGTLRSLEESHEADLAQDRLLGVAEALLVLARWRAAFHGWALDVLGRPAGEEKPESLEAVGRAAGKLLGNQPLAPQLFPRDRFMLQLLEAFVPYEQTLLDAVTASRAPEVEGRSPAKVAEEARQRVDRVLVAEQKVAVSTERLSAAAEPELAAYLRSARKVMLDTAGKLAAGRLPLDDPLRTTLDERTAALTREMGGGR